MTTATTLGKALPIKYGKARNESYGFVAESVPVYGSSGVIGEFNRALTMGPALIVGRKGSAGSIHYSAAPCWPIDTVYYAETPPDSTLHYFRYLLEHLRLGQHDKSTAIPSLGRDDYNAIPVSVPPLAEQEWIVAYLDEQLSRLDASVAALHRVQANLKRYTKSLIQSLTTANESSTWSVVSVDDIAQSLDNMREPVNKTERALRGGSVPYLGANGQTGWIDKPLFDEELVLVVEDETFIGRSQPFCYYFAGECWVNNHTHVLRAKPGVVTAKYLNFALSYYPFIPLTTGSTGRRKLTKKALMAAPLSVPPLAEQHRIVAEADRRLSLIRVAEAQVAANLARAQRLRQSILQAAFRMPAQAGQ